MKELDEDLVSQVCGGNTEAFETLYARYCGVVCAHLLSIVRDRAAADDLVQEVFLRVWNQANQWDGRGVFRGWLFRVATNLAFNYLRTVKRRRECPLDVSGNVEEEDEGTVPGWMVDASALGPDAILEQAEKRRLLLGLIDGLPEEKQEVFRLVYDAQMEMREVARHLEIPEGTVKSRLHHAKKRLAQGWQELEDQEEDFT